MSPNDCAATDAPRVVARLARVFETHLGDEVGMTLPQYRVLAFLSEGEWAASSMADWLAVSRPSVTAMVDGLVERGWVVREQHPDDRRRVLHHLTDAGRAALAEAAAELDGVLGTLLDHLDADERRRAVDGLGVLHLAMRRHHDAKQGVAS